MEEWDVRWVCLREEQLCVWTSAAQLLSQLCSSTISPPPLFHSGSMVWIIKKCEFSLNLFLFLLIARLCSLSYQVKLLGNLLYREWLNSKGNSIITWVKCKCIEHNYNNVLCVINFQCFFPSRALKPQTVMPYTWGDPGGTLSLVWSTGEGKPTRHMLDRVSWVSLHLVFIQSHAIYRTGLMHIWNNLKSVRKNNRTQLQYQYLEPLCFQRLQNPIIYC